MSIDNATHDEWNKIKAGEGANLPGITPNNAMITQPCPHCGYCPTCGRPKYWYPQYPQWPPYTITCGGTQPLGNQQWQAFNANNMNKEPSA